MSVDAVTLNNLLWTGATIGVAYALGLLVNAIVIGRLRKLAARTHGDWDDVVIAELGRRIPLWSVLVGVWIALGYWPLPDRWASFGSNAIRVIGVLSVTLTAAAIASRLVASYGPHITPGVPVSGLMRNMVRILVITLGLLVILRGVGVEITPMLAALGVGGLAIALALQEPLSNLFAGLFITLAGQVRIGDYVRLDAGPEGVISDFNWHSTRIQALAGNLIIVPNAKLAQAIVTNFTLPGHDLGFGVDVTVEYGTDLARVERIAVDVAREILGGAPGVPPDFEPTVRFHTLSDLGVRFSINLRAGAFTDQFVMRHELIRRLTARFAAEGIVMPTLAEPRRMA
jgi:small-conductance mechanosensitive channel